MKMKILSKKMIYINLSQKTIINKEEKKPQAGIVKRIMNIKLYKTKINNIILYIKSQ